MQTFKVLFSFHQTNFTFGELFMSVEKLKFSTTLLYHALADYVVTSTLRTEVKFPDYLTEAGTTGNGTRCPA